MLEKFVANVLTTYLGKYIDNLDRKHVKVSIWNGNVVLENLKLKANALRSFELPISVKDSNIGHLRIYIPWTRLRSEPVKIEITDVTVVVHPKKAAKYDREAENEDRYEMKLEELELFEMTRKDRAADGGVAAKGASPRGQRGASQTDAAEDVEAVDEMDPELDASNKDATFVQRLKATMVKNVQVSVRDVEIEYEDLVTDPLKPIRMSMRFSSFTAHTTDSQWRAHFSSASEVFLHKLLQLQNLSIAVSTGLGGGRNDDEVREVICNPFDVAVRIQHQPIPFHRTIPRWKADVSVSETRLRITRQQWDAIWRSVKYVQQFEHIDAFRRFRPQSTTPLQAPQEWWQYAINSVLHVVQKRRRRGEFCWAEYVQRKAQRGQYMELHKRQLGGEWLLPLTESELEKYDELQRALPVEMIKQARQLASARHALELQQHDARNAYIARQEAKRKQKAGGWFGWWSGKAGPDEAEDDPDDESEVEKLWGLIDSDQWSDEQRRVLAGEFGMDEEDFDGAVPSARTLAASSKTVLVRLVLAKGQLELTDYRRQPFVKMQCERVGTIYRSSENTYEFGCDIGWFAVTEVLALQEQQQRGGADDSSHVLVGIIDELQRHRCALSEEESTEQAAIRLSFQKLCQQDSGGVAFRILGDMRPLNVSLNVPTLQKIVSFWGVNASLVDDIDFGGDQKNAGSSTDDACKRAAPGIPVVSQLVAWYERLQVTQVQLQFSGLRLTLPDTANAQCCTFNFQLVSVVNDVEAQLDAKAKLCEGRVADIVPGDWLEAYQVQLSGLTIGTRYSSPDGTHQMVQSVIGEDIDTVMLVRKSIVKANFDVAIFGVEVASDNPIQLTADRNGYFVLLSAISLLTDFLNNMSGRGTAHAAADMAEAADNRSSGAGDGYIAEVRGPFPAYTVNDVDERTEAAKQLLPAPPTARRFAEITRGYITLFHESRQSMPFARLQNRPGQLTVRKEGREVTLFVHQGGLDHSVRSELKEATALFAACGVPLVPSIPQQRAALALHIEQRESIGEPHSEEVVKRLWSAFAVLKLASLTNACTCFEFKLDDAQVADRFVREVTSNAAVADIPVTSIAGEISDSRKLQKLFDFSLMCPSFQVQVIESDVDVKLTLPENVRIDFALTLYTRFINTSSNGLVLSHGSSDVPLWYTPGAGEEAYYTSVNISFASSWVPQTTPEVALTHSTKTKLVLNAHTVAAIEILWDMMCIFRMGHLTWSHHLASPWGSEAQFDEESKPLTMLLDLSFDNGVECAMQYDDPHQTDALLAVFSGAKVRWTMSEAANITQIIASKPRLDLLFPGAPACFSTFLAPKQDTPATPSLLFSYKVLYKPFDMPAAQWMLQSGGSGFNHTHFLETSVRQCVGAYWQPALWSLLEYFTNGLMIRLGYLGWRPKYSLASVPMRWGSFSLPPGTFNFALLHQSISLLDVDACLPHSSAAAPWLWISIPRLTMFSELRHSVSDVCPDDEDDKEENTNAEVRMGTRMIFSDMTLFAVKDDDSAEYAGAASEGQGRWKTSAVPLRPHRITEAVVSNASMEFNIWFEAASLLKHFSEKTLELLLQRFVFRGSTAQLSTILEWTSRGLMAPWKGFYAPKVWPAKPFPRMGPAAHKPVCFYDWVIRADRFCLHIIEGPRFFLPQKGVVRTSADNPHIVLDIVGIDVALRWFDDASFSSVTTLVSAFGWDLSNAQLKACTTIFASDPRELVSSRRNVLRVVPDAAQGDKHGAVINYGWGCDGPDKEVFGEYFLSLFELDIVPRFIQHLRDTLLSLRMRNALAPILKWPQYVVGVSPAPWDPRSQQWRVRQEFRFHTLALLLFADPTACVLDPVFQLALADLHGVNILAREAVRSELVLKLSDVSSNGIVQSDNTIRPVIVPQSHMRGATDSLLWIKKASDTGIEGVVGCTWIFNPRQENILKLRDAVQHPALAELQWVWEYKEERDEKKRASAEIQLPAAPPTHADDVAVTIFNPCLVISEHEDVTRGIVINLGQLRIQRQLIDEECPAAQRVKLVVESANVTSLHSQGEYLLTPTNAALDGVLRDEGTSDFHVHIDAIMIDVAQEYYEALLHSAVRHLVLDESELVVQKEEQDRQRAQSIMVLSPGGTPKSPATKGGAGTRRRAHAEAGDEQKEEVAPGEKEMSGREATAVWAATAAAGGKSQRAVSLTLDWERMQLRVHSDTVAVVFATGLLHADYSRERDFYRCLLCLDGARLGVEGRKPLLTILASSDGNAEQKHAFPRAAASAAATTTTTTSSSSRAVSASTTPRAAEQPSPPQSRRQLSVEVTQNGIENIISGDLASVGIYLDHNAVVPAIAFLYEPYRRIVLPRYGVSEVFRVEESIVLTSRLVLSSRKVLHVAAAKVNYIVIDCQGHEVYFLDAQKPIMIIEPGVTVEFICGKIYLFEHPLEHYIAAGNGSYVVMEDARNAVSRSETLEGFGVATNATPQLACGAAAIDDYTRRIQVRGHLSITLPEGAAKPNAVGGRRALTLRTEVTVSHHSRIEFGDFSESGTLAIDQLHAECIYLHELDEALDFSSLISPWSIVIAVEGKCSPSTQQVLTRNITIKSKAGVDIRFRFGDFQLVAHALNHSRRSLTHIESEVLGAQDSLGDEVEVRKASAASTRMGISVDLPRVAFFVIDDSSGSVDFPLLYMSLLDIRTPTLDLSVQSAIADISMHSKIEYYNLRIGGWDTLLQRVELRFAMKDVKNISMQDIQSRKGQLKIGLYVDDFRLHLTPMAAHTAHTVNKLLGRLIAFDVSAATPSTAVSEQPVKQRHTQGQVPPRSSIQQFATAEEFFTYVVEQNVGMDIVVGFADNDEPRFPRARTLGLGDKFGFNFPRINGREIPISQHYILLNGEEPVNIAHVGLYAVNLRHGANVIKILADVQLSEGRKVVKLRTNVTFTNKLRYPVCVAGVGDVRPNDVLNVPIDSMRKRCAFCPKVAERCHDVSLGIPFQYLPALFEQEFLCTSELDEPDLAQRAFFYMLRFGPQIPVAKSTSMRDICGTFEAPFNIINYTGLPVQVSLTHRYLKRNHSKSKLMTVITGDSEYYFNQITTINIGVQDTYPVTEVNPLENVYMDLVITQPTGKVLARMGGIAPSEKQPPALIRSRHKGIRDRVMHLWDEEGKSLTLLIEYNDRDVCISAAFWVVNQTQHYLQIADTNPKKKKRVMCAGLPDDGLPPLVTPLLVGTEKMLRNSSKCRVYVRVGQYTTNGEMSWSLWSDAVNVEQITDMATCECSGGSGRSSSESSAQSTVSLSFSVQLVGGPLKGTRVIKFTPRWIVINRCPKAVAIWQQIADADQTALPCGHSHTLDKAMKEEPNQLRIAFCEDNELSHCEWSSAFCIDKFSERLLNIKYGSRSEPQKRQFSVLRVSCYARSSIMYVDIDSCPAPPYLIENRTTCVVYCRQADAPMLLTVYPRSTKGFVWDDTRADPVLLLWAAERDAQHLASRPITINLDPIKLTKQTHYQLSQDVMLPGGTVLFVRVRAHGTSYAISVTHDTVIDKFRLLPFFQFSAKLQIKSIGILVGEDRPLWMGLSVSGVTAAVAQNRRAGGDNDEFSVDVVVGELQVDDYRPLSKQKVVLQSVIGKKSSLSLVRPRERTNPMIHLTKFDVVARPIQIHLEDSFLFEAIKLGEKFSEALGNAPSVLGLCTFEVAPWVGELQKKPSSSDALQWRVAFVEHMLIEQLVISISLYRGADKNRDPIREQLGVVSLMIRSVQDARFEWRRIELSNVDDQVWIFATKLRNYYELELRQQVLNVVHVAGLDTMRGFVTDLLDGYFSTSVGHIDRAAPLVQRGMDSPAAADALGGHFVTSGDDWFDIKPAEAQGMVLPSDAARRNRKAGGNPMTMEQFAERTTWDEFVDGVSPGELRENGHLALFRAFRTRDMAEAAPASPCKRCAYIEQLRQERWDAEQMSVLPHPCLGQLNWHELAHHATWEEFTSLCTPQEVQQWAQEVRDNLLGSPYSVKRVTADMLAILEDRDAAPQRQQPAAVRIQPTQS